MRSAARHPCAAELGAPGERAEPAGEGGGSCACGRASHLVGEHGLEGGHQLVGHAAGRRQRRRQRALVQRVDLGRLGRRVQVQQQLARQALARLPPATRISIEVHHTKLCQAHCALPPSDQAVSGRVARPGAVAPCGAGAALRRAPAEGRARAAHAPVEGVAVVGKEEDEVVVGLPLHLEPHGRAEAAQHRGHRLRGHVLKHKLLLRLRQATRDNTASVA